MEQVHVITGGFYGVGDVVGRSYHEKRCEMGQASNIWHVLPKQDSQVGYIVHMWNILFNGPSLSELLAGLSKGELWGITERTFCGPEAVPVTKPAVSMHWRDVGYFQNAVKCLLAVAVE